ncbi:hypothetical protein IFM89_038126 [Coptis chinensis]|uniref:Proteasomal ATPase second OB domain-containing protein n=1 Tax=Coptis chinensis TaxID=261450 RepID=A0A835HV63_9MAGN|nr:hypothetical protein IFM89_038126 [Coptis chinensis]
MEQQHGGGGGGEQDVWQRRKEALRAAKKEYAKIEDDLKSLQSVGQIIGEVLRPLDNERLIVKANSGPRYVVGCRSKVDKEILTVGTRVVLDMTTLTILHALPHEVRSQPGPNIVATYQMNPLISGIEGVGVLQQMQNTINPKTKHSYIISIIEAWKAYE